mgnify:CR=1 FL=1|jgi:hypothetical protein
MLRNKYKVPKEVKERMERELRQYWINKKKLEDLKLKIIESSNNSSDTQIHSSSISDTTSQKALKILSTRSILYCEERITYIENVIKKLNPLEQQVFEYIFKNGYDFMYCQTMKNIDKNTYYNVRNKSIYFLAQEWGEI